tara:strand:- start:4529 stop:4765 length:237 start_codon:yes stop_codon:yes gene_type:complete
MRNIGKGMHYISDYLTVNNLEESGAPLEKTIAAVQKLEKKMIELDEFISCEIEAAQLSKMERLIENGCIPAEAAEMLG